LVFIDACFLTKTGELSLAEKSKDPKIHHTHKLIATDLFKGLFFQVSKKQKKLVVSKPALKKATEDE